MDPLSAFERFEKQELKLISGKTSYEMIPKVKEMNETPLQRFQRLKMEISAFSQELKLLAKVNLSRIDE